MSAQFAFRASGILLWISAFGLGVPCLHAIQSLLQGRGVPTVLGFPAYGGGPFERIGISTTVPLIVAFLLVCVLECVAGWLLWDGRRSGAVLALGLVPVGAVFWWGFALPIPPLLAVVRTILILVNWRSLK